jgi:catechol 2,3-dioxygenase-like lactoylglutathione lyase family enzyme
MENDRDTATASAVIAQPKCYGITIFTQQYNAVRDFYVDLLNARVVQEKFGHFCNMDLAGIPVCLQAAENSEMVSYFHLNLVLKRQDSLLAELRRQGIIVTTVGPFTNFRDPEGRVVKLSEEQLSTR